MNAMTSDQESAPFKVSPTPTSRRSSFQKVSSAILDKGNLTSQLNASPPSLHINILSTKDRDRDENKNKGKEKDRTAPPATAIEKLKLRLIDGRKSTRMDLSTKMLWALDNGRARTICYPISVRKKSHSMLEECKHIDQELRNERNANMVRIKQNIFGENRSNHQNENKKDSDEEHQHHRENHIHEMEEEKNGDDELNVLRNEEFLDKECMDIDVVIEGKEMEIEKNESDSISSNQFKELTEAQVTDNDVSNEDIRVNDIDHCINIQTIIQPTASDIDRNYPQNQIVPSESHERQIEKSVSFAMADSFFPHKEVLCSVENEGKDCLPLQMTSSDDLREPSAPITTTPQLQKMTHQSTVITDNTTGNNFSLTSDGIPNETLDLTDSSSLSRHGCLLNDIFEETRHLQQLIIPRNHEGNILSSPIFLNSNIALHSSTSTTCSTPYSFASPYLMSPFETSPPTPTIGLSLPSSPSQNKNRQKPLDAFFEGKEYENDFESENDLLAPKGKSLDLQIFEYFNKSRMLSRNKEIENKNVIDCGSGESGSITAVDKSKIIASNIVEYKKGNYGYNIPKGANGYIFERVTGTGDYLILKTDTLKIHTNENIESAGMTIDENDRGSSKKGEKVVDFEEIQDKDERVIANLKLKSKLKKMADSERKEAFKRALIEARSKVSMSAEFTISVIPEHVLKMTKLTELWLCNNMIKILPPEIGNLKNLIVLSIKGNLLESIPDEICLLEKLKRLYLNDNKIRKFPNLMESMKKLVDLDIKNNKFDSFPDVICTLRSLVHLNMSENTFDNIPIKFSRLRSLINLSLTNTVISGDCSVLSSLFWVNIIGYDAIPLQGSLSALSPSKIILKSELSSEDPDLSITDLPVTITSNSIVLTTTASPVQGIDIITCPKGPLKDDDEDMDAFLRNRASCRIAAKLRRRKGKRSSMSSPLKPTVVARLPLLL